MGYWPGNDIRYTTLEDVSVDELPVHESLKCTAERFLPYWESTLRPAVASGQRLLIAAHGNSLRALVMHLDGISEDDITGLNIPTGAPLVYDFDKNMQVVEHPDALAPMRGRYLMSAAEAKKRAEEVANQTKGG